MADAACYGCFEERQMGAVAISLLVKLIQFYDPMASADVDDLMADAVCYTCLEPRQMGAIQLDLLRQVVDLITSGAASGVDCGDVDPVAAPLTTCRFYYNRVSGGMWYWNATTAVWHPWLI